MAKNEASELVTRLAAEYAAMLELSMPRLEQALHREHERQASFTVTAQFKIGKEGDVSVSLNPRERIPLEAIELKLRWHGQQLELFE